MKTHRTQSATTKTGRTAPGDAPAANSWRTLFLQREVWGLVITAIGLITLIALFSQGQGKLSAAWALSLRQVFGLGAYPVALLCLASGVALLAWNWIEPYLHPRWQVWLGSFLCFWSLLGLIHVAAGDAPLAMAKAGRAGGYAGWVLWQLFVPVLGRWFSLLFLSIAVLATLYWISGIPWERLTWRARWLWAHATIWLRRLIVESQNQARAQREQRERQAQRPSAEVGTRSGEPRFLAPTTWQPPQSKPRKQQEAATPAAVRPSPTRVSPTPKAPAGAAQLPPLELLTPDDPMTDDDTDARHRAQIIEETLEAFGIPAEVTEWHRGPAVTQFGVEPGFIERMDRDGTPHRYKVRVSKILSLANDLALALAAPSIRIEAPVPGRAMVGIEVPNGVRSLVNLRGALESKEFEQVHGPLRIALGRDVSGQVMAASLAGMPHLLLAGATGTGKSVCLNAIIASLLFFHTPEQLNLLLVDPKRVELTNYNGIPHLIAPVVVDVEKVIVALRWTVKEMERRYARFAEAGVRNLVSYNKRAKLKGLESLPFIVVIIDELADLMLAAPDDVEQMLCRIAQMARATGIHLVVATQRPSVDVVTGLIKANFPARISFAVTSQIDSRVILDTAGAEKLLGRGDMLYMPPDSPRLQRIQGCWVSEKELDALVAFWRAVKREQSQPEAEEAPEPWEGMSLDVDDGQDDLLEQAVELVRQHNQASASFLQRQMKIGYPRAARLIDQLEDIGVVGPPETGGRSRSVRLEAVQEADAPSREQPE